MAFSCGYSGSSYHGGGFLEGALQDEKHQVKVVFFILSSVQFGRSVMSDSL